MVQQRKKLAAAGVAMMLMISGSHVATATTDDSSTGDRGDPRSVTLITGDRVLADTSGAPTAVIPANGREDVGYSTFETDGHSFVVPLDAGPLLASGKLDRRLFDVAELAAGGYADSARDTLPLLVNYRAGHDPSAGIRGAPGTQVRRTLSSVNGAAVSATKSSLPGTWSALTAGLTTEIDTVWLDGRRKATLDVSVPQIGAPAAWKAGFTGDAVRIAVLDTGVDESHPDLADQEVAQQNFSDAETNDDIFGHGTHVASIAAGTGEMSDGRHTGAAHGADIVDGKVLNDFGFGFDSWIIAGMEWAAIDQDADIANLSLGAPNTPEIDPVEQAVNTLTAQHGTLFVVAGGNSGPRTSSIGSPGSARSALTVGAVDDENQLANFSSRGPIPSARAVKPDITAPGVDIVAALSSHSDIGDPVGEGYTELSGTSMATPHVAGAAALLLDQHPDLTADEIKGMLIGSARPTKGLGVYDQGAGRVDSATVLDQTVYAQPASIPFGIQEWPHFGEEPVREDVTYTNLGDTPVTVELRVEATGPDGKPVSGELFRLSTKTLTVPAGATGTAPLIADINAVGEPGFYTGTLIAKTPEQTVRTPVSINREPESHNLALRMTDRTGALTGNHFTTLLDIDTGEVDLPHEQDGTVSLRVPKGGYLLQSIIRTGTGPDRYRDLLTYPDLRLNRDLAVDLDARATKPFKVSPPDSAAEPAFGQIQYTRHVPGGRDFISGMSAFDSPIDHLGTAHLGPRLPLDQLVTLINTQWDTPRSAKFYGLAWYEYGAVPTGFVRLVRPSDLATVHANYAAARDGTVGRAGASPSQHLRPRQTYSRLIEVPLPGTRTEYYNLDDHQVDWNRSLYTSDKQTGLFSSRLQAPPRQYSPQRSYTEWFNRAVFGPVLPVTYQQQRWMTRNGDTIHVNTPLFGDGDGNWGRSTTNTARTRLYRDNDLIGDIPSAGVAQFQVPGGEASHRLAVEASRPSAFDLSTLVAVAWTFRSNTTDQPTRLPISTIRYFPALDENNSAPAGQPFVVPVAVQPQASQTTSAPYRLTAEASYDHGRTWTPATVGKNNSRLFLQHPANAPSVSLRATAVDGNGNTVEQTIIDTYRLR